VFAGTTYALSESMSTGWLLTLRGRIGYTVLPDFLLYATGGLALTDFTFSSSYRDNANNGIVFGGTGFGERSEVKPGWVVGGGGEWLLDSRWSVKAEYLYLDFGSMGVAVPVSNSPAFTQTMVVDTDLSAQVARIGINFRP
jgi:outer membrane immunogenic protein